MVNFNLQTLERERVLKEAEEALRRTPAPLTKFLALRSAGGPHDFFSEGDYWWPDPQNPGGPYIQRDGMTNPDNFVAHRHAMISLSRDVAALVAAYRLTRQEQFAEHARQHLYAWFVDDNTRMNPHLLYAQAIQGRVTGRGIGLIDTIHLIEVTRGVMILERESAVDEALVRGVKDWFTAYLKWVTTHPYGLAEKEAGNNHGTCWVMQVAAFARLVGDEMQLRECRRLFAEVLLPQQMAPDGSFPLELKRTKPYCYSLFNLDAMTTVCHLLSNLQSVSPQENLWRYVTADGRSLQLALQFMLPYIKDKSKWPYPPDVMYWEFWPVRSLALLFAAQALNEPSYFECWKTLDPHLANEEVIRNVPLRQPLLWIE